MANSGQPTSYKAEYCAQARNYCRLGATNEELAKFFEVSPRTIDNWMATHAPFGEAVRDGRLLADAEVANRLYERAIGFEQVIERREAFRGEEKVITTKVHYPPDTNACMFWLRNRQPKLWRHRIVEEPSTNHEELLAILEAAGERVARARARMDGAPPPTTPTPAPATAA